MTEIIEEYVKCSKEMPLWADIEDKQVRGFITLKETSPFTVELYVMGVLKEFHRNKIGNDLFKTCYEYSKDQGYLYMQVKTVKKAVMRSMIEQLPSIRILDLKNLNVFLYFGMNGILVRFTLYLLNKF
ncbi:GNAT family N-acetyltransferase [Clostridium gasigenes]|uniref:N-acetyltransferase domain-containing protein n=1 Tax=Clostridium gasigenes TaxID=94869 RepID=A0A1H0LRB1_9CLOT|nr:GNAT family N-acetyltransferase [Clostridium gasigenes]SDO70762.1 hypothetical protein SAMN04488529_101175 [Clostridium gasigenes]